MGYMLYYVGDPMCSWCWGFRPVLAEVVETLPESLPLTYVMGGLAKDSDEPMPAEVREYVQMNWRQVEVETGATFNWEFWTKCDPRRSTYPACRAVLAAAAQRTEAGPEIFDAIQRAYYGEARNPSDMETLVGVGSELSRPLDLRRFERDIRSPEIEDELQKDLNLRRSLGVREFPSLVLRKETDEFLVRGYRGKEDTLARLREALEQKGIND